MIVMVAMITTITTDSVKVIDAVEDTVVGIIITDIVLCLED